MRKSTKLIIFTGFVVGVLLSCQVSNTLFGPTLMPTFAPGISSTEPQNPDPTAVPTEISSGSDQVSTLVSSDKTDGLFADDFSTTDSGWKTANFIEGSTEYFNDGFRIKLNRSQYLLWSTAGRDFENVRLKVQATLIGGGEDNAFGLICRYLDSNNFYAFVISSDGYYAIRKRVQGGFLTVIGSEGYQFSDRINLGTTENQLRAECSGNRLRFYVNGVLLAEAVDSELSHGDVGVIAGTFSADTTQVFFDNFEAEILE